MGSYISQSDIEDIYGQENVAQWSNLTGANTVDTGRVTSAISWAEAKVENKFRNSRYSVPFVSTGTYDEQLIDWCAAYAGYWLYRARKTRKRNEADDQKPQPVLDAEGEISAVLAGAVDLDLQLEGEPSPETPAVVT